MNPKIAFLSLLFILSIFASACEPAPEAPTVTPPSLPTIPPTAAATATSEPSPTPSEVPSATAFPTPEGGSTQVSAVDGMVMVYIPVGEFSMGSTIGTVDEQPVHTVSLGAYWIDRTEVTNAMYTKCVDAGVCLRPYVFNSNTHYAYYFSALYVDFPVIALKWSSAETYCTWAGRRLPTEAEWEKAAVGTDGRLYPWGNAEPSQNLLNFNRIVNDTTQVGSYSLGASPYGVWDMAGNLNEWVSDWYGETYYASSPATDPNGPEVGQFKVLRGGSWVSSEFLVRSADRHWLEPDTREITVGFRCAVSSP